jgi:chemotaxis protein CheX
MSTTASAPAMTAEFVNPVLAAVKSVFESMLACTPRRTGLVLKENMSPRYELSAVIGVSGRVAGTVVLSHSSQTAFAILDRLVGIQTTEITAEVRDAVGELTNMIAGRAKAGLEHLSMTLALPTVVTGKNHVISFGSAAQTICIPYSCAWGEFTLEVGLVEHNLATAPTLAAAGAC